MKKTAIVLFVLVTAFSYSCKKEGREVSTTIYGQLLTNGTSDKIKMSIELERPKVVLYEETDGIDIYPSGFKEIASTTVDEYAIYRFNIDLHENNTYFIGFHNVDESMYLDVRPDQWHGVNTFNHITAGISNNMDLHVLAISWVRHRLINSNPNPNNNDVFDCPMWGTSLQGPTDSIMPWVDKTWSGTYKYNIQSQGLAHIVKAKLTRNGITRDTSIIYSVPPFDTTVVEIRY